MYNYISLNIKGDKNMNQERIGKFITKLRKDKK